MRLMGLDVGDKTIGIAVSDELGLAAHPLTVVRRTGSVKKEIAEVLHIAEEKSVTEIVVGKPLMMDGSVGIQAEKVAAFVEAVRRRTKIPVVEWDERLTTMEVERILLDADESRARRKQVIDKMAAAVMLGAYMNRQQYARREVTDEAPE